MSFPGTTVGLGKSDLRSMHVVAVALYPSSGRMLKWNEVWARFLSVCKARWYVTDAVPLADEGFSS
jgi:hypothetical protein